MQMGLSAFFHQSERSSIYRRGSLLEQIKTDSWLSLGESVVLAAGLYTLMGQGVLNG